MDIKKTAGTMGIWVLITLSSSPFARTAPPPSSSNKIPRTLVISNPDFSYDAKVTTIRSDKVKVPIHVSNRFKVEYRTQDAGGTKPYPSLSALYAEMHKNSVPFQTISFSSITIKIIENSSTNNNSSKKESITKIINASRNGTIIFQE